MQRTRYGLGVILLVLTMVLSACGGQKSGTSASGDSSGGAQDVMVIGGVGPLSQPGAVEAGNDMKWAMDEAVKDINAKGGVLGKQVKLVFYDTQNQPDVAASLAKKMVDEDHVVAVVGEYHSGPALAMIPTLTKAKIPAIFSETWNDKITGGDPNDPNLPPQPPTIFRIAPASSYAQGQIADWLVGGLKVKKVVHVYEATEFGIGQSKVLKDQMAQAGVTVVQTQVELNQADYSAVLSRLAQENPDADAAVFDLTGESSYVIEQNAVEVGLVNKHTVCVANQVAQDDQAFWRAVPDGAGCVFQLVGLVPSQYNDMSRSVADRYQQKFGNGPKVWVFEAYDSVWLVADAIQRAGSTDGMAIAKALEQTSFVGTQGKYEFPSGSGNPVPADKPAWLWHQWPNPPIQLLEYYKKGQTLGEAAVVWPEARQTNGKAYVPVE